MTSERLHLGRIAPRPEPQRLPSKLSERGLYMVDATWGTIQPIEIAPGIRTVGELEVVEHVGAGRPIVDTRIEASHADAAIPGSHSIPRGRFPERIGDLATDVPTVFFCNGPQCAATPATIRVLLEAGHPAELILYYRGGMHDWITLGLPVAGRHARDQGRSRDRPVIAAG